MLSPGDRLGLGGDAEHPQPLGVAVHVPEEPQRHRGVHPHQNPPRAPVSREHLNTVQYSTVVESTSSTSAFTFKNLLRHYAKLTLYLFRGAFSLIVKLRKSRFPDY